MDTVRSPTAVGEVIAFRSSSSKALWATGWCAAIAALAGYAAVLAGEWWPWLLTAYFGVGAAFVILNGLIRPATLRVDAQGVHLTHWRYRWSVSWGELAEVQLVVLHINWCRLKANVVLRDKAGKKHTISSGLTITPDKLADLIRSFATFG